MKKNSLIKKLSIFAVVGAILPLVSCGVTINNDPVQKVKVTFFEDTLLKDVSVRLYKDGKYVNQAKTNEEGIASISVPAFDKYQIFVTDMKPGYTAETSYYTDTTGEEVTVNCITSLIRNTIPNEHQFKLNDILYDFALPTPEGTKISLANELKNKKLVILNFWANYCGPCHAEMPFLQSGYERYKDEISIIGINIGYPAYESNVDVKSVREQYGITFPLVLDTPRASDGYMLADHFYNYVQYIPTSIIVDRYGKFAACETISIQSDAAFDNLISHFVADDYSYNK